MSRIGASISGIERTLLNRLAESNAAATLASLRIATGSKINYPRDDPAAFVQLSLLRTQLSNVTDAAANVTAASSMITQAQTALDSIRTQLNTMRTELLTDEDYSLTAEQRLDAQADIDAAIEQINSLAGTDINGRRLLDGSADFNVSGADSTQVLGVTVHSTGGATLTISGRVTTAATQAELTYEGKGGSKVKNDATFTLSGDAGSYGFSANKDDKLDDVADEINQYSHRTGVTASVDGDTLTFTSVEYGSDTETSIAVSSGTFDVSDGGTDNGTDATALIDGVSYTGDGNRVAVYQNQSRYEVEFDPTFTGAFDPITVDGEALSFALATDLAYRSTLAVPGVQPGQLGRLSGTLDELHTGGTLSGLSTDTAQAIRVVDEALGELTRIEGSVDGFYNAAITSSSALFSAMETNLENAIDDIDLADYTEESLRVAYYQDLAANAVAGLSILNGQRSSIVTLLWKQAGLL